MRKYTEKDVTWIAKVSFVAGILTFSGILSALEVVTRVLVNVLRGY